MVERAERKGGGGLEHCYATVSRFARLLLLRAVYSSVVFSYFCFR